MFNRQPFGKLKFNTSVTDSKNTANINFELKVKINSNLSINSSIKNAFFILQTKCKDEISLFAHTTKSYFNFNIKVSSFNKIYPSKSYSKIDLKTVGKTQIRNIFSSETLTELKLDFKAVSLRKLFILESFSSLNITIMANPTRILFLSPLDIKINLDNKANGLVNIYPLPSKVNFILETYGTGNMYGFSVLELPNLILKPNSELIIDTEQMTVILDGQDVTRYFGNYSEFFNLLSGENILIYEDDESSRKILYKVLWKDRWL